MSLTLASMLILAQNCAPVVAPETLLSVSQVESGFDPLTIGVNGRAPRALHPPTRQAAIQQAGRLIASGANVDLGIAQINSRNLSWLGLSLADAFDPCRNLAAAAKVLVANYTGVAGVAAGEQTALKAAISMYNTGDQSRGLRNGYVQKVSRAANYIVPAIQTDAGDAAAAPARPEPPPGPEAVMLTAAEPEPPAWDVFARPNAREAMVFKAGAATASSRRTAPSRKVPGDRHDR
jgi:type IV secretion system protein VirB1